MKKLLLFFILLSSFTVHAEVDPKLAYQEVLASKAILIDVREPDEIKLGMIEKAQWFPLSRIKSDPAWKSAFDKLVTTKKIYLYCRTGNRSGQVKAILQGHQRESFNLGGYSDLAQILPTTRP